MMMKKIVTVVLALAFAASVSIAAETPKTGKVKTSTPSFQYSIAGKKVSLGMTKASIQKLFKNLSVENPSDPSEKEYLLLTDRDNKFFYFKDDKLAMMRFSYRNESILQIPEKHLGKGKVIKEEPNFVTEWKKGGATITRTDFPLSDGGEDSESEVVIK